MKQFAERNGKIIVIEAPEKPTGTPPYQPFYKPYGMGDEEYSHEKRVAANKLEQWQEEIEQEYQELLTRALAEGIEVEDQRKTKEYILDCICATKDDKGQSIGSGSFVDNIIAKHFTPNATFPTVEVPEGVEVRQWFDDREGKWFDRTKYNPPKESEGIGYRTVYRFVQSKDFRCGEGENRCNCKTPADCAYPAMIEKFKALGNLVDSEVVDKSYIIDPKSDWPSQIKTLQAGSEGESSVAEEQNGEVYDPSSIDLTKLMIELSGWASDKPVTVGMLRFILNKSHKRII